MNKDEATSLAKDIGALICSGAMTHYTYPPELAGTPCSDSISFDPSMLLDFANACEKIGMEKLRPFNWTKEMSDAWHQNIPDVHAAFDALIKKSI